MLVPIEGQPGLYRNTETGQVLNIRDWAPFETSELVTGIDWQWFRPEPFHPADDFIIQGWRFTVARWPDDSRSVQQQVSLNLGGIASYEEGPHELRTAACVSLRTILTDASVSDPDRSRSAEMLRDHIIRRTYFVGIKLHEMPVEGAGLRVHLRGLWRKNTKE